MSNSPISHVSDNWCAALPLLYELGTWRRAAGYDPDEDGASDIRSSGESNAALTVIKQRLAALAVAYHWCADCQEYHLRFTPAPELDLHE